MIRKTLRFKLCSTDLSSKHVEIHGEKHLLKTVGAGERLGADLELVIPGSLSFQWQIIIFNR